ncbi:MAG: DNA primase [Saccharofermentans sp.]|nr:DNA primase [Saccharofermentans sp.]
MGRIPDSVIAEVLNRADIVDVVGSYVSLKPKGGNYWACCPFHGEKTPSFSVNPARGIFKCFGCNKGGNAIGFIMEMERLNYPEAIRFLADKYGVNIPDTGYDDGDDLLRKKKERVSGILKEACKYFYYSLYDEEVGRQGMQYARARGFDDNTLKHFGIGFAPDQWEGLYNTVRALGYTDEEMMESGLFTRTKKGNVIDLFRNRLMFPIFDVRDNIIAFGGRAITPVEERKYINSPDSLVYNKQKHLYALNWAKKEKSNQLIIVEGYMDAISMHRAGFRNTVASLGTAFTADQLKLCARYTTNGEVVFFFDADSAGQSAAMRAIPMMCDFLRKNEKSHIRIKIAKVPDGKDPDEFIKVNGAGAFADVVRNAYYVEDYLLDRAYSDNFDKKSGLDTGKYQEDVCLYGSWMNDEIAKSKMANAAANKLGANSDIVLRQMISIAERKASDEDLSRSREASRAKQADMESRNRELPTEGSEITEEANNVAVSDQATNDEIMLFAFAMSLQESLTDQAMLSKTDIIRPSDFAGDTMKTIVSRFFELYDPEFGASFARMMETFMGLTINGEAAEDVMARAYDKACASGSIQTRRDMYLGYLFRIRIKALEEKERYLIDSYKFASEEDRAKIQENLRKITQYKQQLMKAGENL